MPEFNTKSNITLPVEELRKIANARCFTVDDLLMFNSIFAGHTERILRTGVLWATQSGEAPDGFSNSDIELTEEDLRELADDVLYFCTENRDDLHAYATSAECYAMDLFDSWEQLGHNFALTRNNPDRSFWGSGDGVVEKRLTEASHAYDEVGIYASVKDGKLCFSFES